MVPSNRAFKSCRPPPETVAPRFAICGILRRRLRLRIQPAKARRNYTRSRYVRGRISLHARKRWYSFRWCVDLRFEELQRLPRKDPEQWCTVSPSFTALADHDMPDVSSPMTATSVAASSTLLCDHSEFVQLLSQFISGTSSRITRRFNASITTPSTAPRLTPQGTSTGDIRNQYDHSLFRQRRYRRNQDF